MTRIKECTHIFISIIIVAGFAAVVWVIGDATGAWRLYAAQQETRAAEARASALQAEADALAARRELWSTGALAFAVVKDSLLVTFTFICNSLLLFVVVVAIVQQRNKQPNEVEDGN